ncbi:MAG: SH3 domain-containing protein, partial [Bacteroidota bacterium]|nr:SH3 domain-containing protein [Bacteroidota bacterium]
LQLDPGNDDIQYNLQIANKLVVDKIEVLPEFILKTWLRKFTNLFSSNFWAVVSISSFILMLIFFAAYFFTSKINIKKLSFWFGILLFSISTFAFISSLKQQKNIITNNSAIIFTPSVTTKSSPDDSGTDLFLVHEGTKVNINDKVGEWIEIKLSDGNKGWVKIEDVRFI